MRGLAFVVVLFTLFSACSELPESPPQTDQALVTLDDESSSTPGFPSPTSSPTSTAFATDQTPEPTALGTITLAVVPSTAIPTDIPIETPVSPPSPIPTATPGSLLPPFDLSVTVQGSGQIDVVWEDTNGDETGYLLYRSSPGTGSWAKLVALGANVTSFSDGTLEPNTNYHYRAVAMRGAEVSDYSVDDAAITDLLETAQALKVAFIGDQAINANALAVLNLISSEGAELVLHQGDLWYGDESSAQSVVDWEAQVDSVLGSSFPYFASIGNHDLGMWSTYQPLLQARIDRVEQAECAGEPDQLGIKTHCMYKGLDFHLMGAGTSGAGFDAYIEDELADSDSIWRICSWHKNQASLQVGAKPDEVTWGPYENCRLGGAIIATGHEHSYQRTKTLSNMESQTIDPSWPDGATVSVGDGSSFVFVSGLGGISIRAQTRCLPATPPYGCGGEWASIYTTNQNANYGALFITFYVDGDKRKASGYFKNIDDEIIDQFVIFSQN